MTFTDVIEMLKTGNINRIHNFMSAFDIRLFYTRLPDWQDEMTLQNDADLNRN